MFSQGMLAVFAVLKTTVFTPAFVWLDWLSALPTAPPAANVVPVLGTAVWAFVPVHGFSFSNSGVVWMSPMTWPTKPYSPTLAVEVT